ncbi:kinase-like protein [Thozetella sp. PMI_491]|nr:kinase-like protein [Thozetella sp. PMI_491]
MPFHFRWEDQHKEIPLRFRDEFMDWDALLDIAKAESKDDGCQYQENLHEGGRHRVRRLFLPKTGKLWLVRVPIQSPWTEGARLHMESEIATMIYISRYTDIPVPKVFHYNTRTEGNPVKVPYILMECIEGNILPDLIPGGRTLLTDEQKAKIRVSVASIQCKVASVPLDALGCLRLGPGGSIEVGPLPYGFGNEGPFRSTEDYLQSWARHRSQMDNLGRQVSASVIQRLIAALPRLQTKERGRYPIVHPDFDLHNLLFDDDWEVVGVIDWEGSHTAPWEEFAARMNIYSTFDGDLLTLTWMLPEGPQYLSDVVHHEKEMGISLSTSFGSSLGDIGWAMARYEEYGREQGLDMVLQGLEKKDGSK